MSDKRPPELFYLLRRAAWLEEKTARGDPNSAGHIFDASELAELKQVFGLLGIPYRAERSARTPPPPPAPTRTHVHDRREEPPRIGETVYPKPRSRARDVDERHLGGRFIPGGEL